MTRQEAENYINNIPKFADKTGPENTEKLMAILGNPERKAKTVHVAGTNGKGSVSRMMSLFLREAGFKTGLFISPHLVRINERISVQGQDISDEDFGRIFDTVKDASDKLIKEGGAHPAYFEFLFAMGAVYFAECECDYVVYETGLGGRLDATNCIKPCMTAITEIGMDHMQYLGDTIEKIAGEKAGIIKKGVPLVYFTGRVSANRVLEHTARVKGCPAFNACWTTIDVKEENKGKIDFSLDTRYYTYDNLVLNEAPRYQTRNAATAVYMFDRLFHEWDVSRKQEIIRKGLDQFKMDGRFQYLKENVILDGAHNEDAAQELIGSLRSRYTGFRSMKKKLLFAIASDKDYDKVINEMAFGIRPEKVYITELASGRRLDKSVAEKGFKAALGDKVKVSCYSSSREAYKEALGELSDDEILIVTGSLYLAGELLGQEI